MSNRKQKIYIAAYHGRSLLSRLIQWRTWSPISHVACIRSNGRVIEAWGRGGVRHVESFHFGHTPGTLIDLYEMPDWTETARRKYWNFLNEQVGKKYDWRGVLGFLSRRDAAENQNRWFCSELIHAGSVAVGSPLLNVPSRRVAPGDIVASPALTYYGSVRVDPVNMGQIPALVNEALRSPVSRPASRPSRRPYFRPAFALSKMQYRATDVFNQPATAGA